MKEETAMENHGKRSQRSIRDLFDGLRGETSRRFHPYTPVLLAGTAGVAALWMTLWALRWTSPASTESLVFKPGMLHATSYLASRQPGNAALPGMEPRRASLLPPLPVAPELRGPKPDRPEIPAPELRKTPERAGRFPGGFTDDAQAGLRRLLEGEAGGLGGRGLGAGDHPRERMRDAVRSVALGGGSGGGASTTASLAIAPSAGPQNRSLVPVSGPSQSEGLLARAGRVIRSALGVSKTARKAQAAGLSAFEASTARLAESAGSFAHISSSSGPMTGASSGNALTGVAGAPAIGNTSSTNASQGNRSESGNRTGGSDWFAGPETSTTGGDLQICKLGTRGCDIPSTCTASCRPGENALRAPTARNACRYFCAPPGQECPADYRPVVAEGGDPNRYTCQRNGSGSSGGDNGDSNGGTTGGGSTSGGGNTGDPGTGGNNGDGGTNPPSPSRIPDALALRLASQLRQLTRGRRPELQEAAGPILDSLRDMTRTLAGDMLGFDSRIRELDRSLGSAAQELQRDDTWAAFAFCVSARTRLTRELQPELANLWREAGLAGMAVGSLQSAIIEGSATVDQATRALGLVETSLENQANLANVRALRADLERNPVYGLQTTGASDGFALLWPSIHSPERVDLSIMELFRRIDTSLAIDPWLNVDPSRQSQVAGPAGSEEGAVSRALERLRDRVDDVLDSLQGDRSEQARQVRSELDAAVAAFSRAGVHVRAIRRASGRRPDQRQELLSAARGLTEGVAKVVSAIRLLQPRLPRPGVVDGLTRRTAL
ncbi:MAG: hypothetical protein HY553_14920 [Elusimicrobia bacterium]|nr:hypothetical protein [Elusimicrobiota bacterium]